MIKAIVFDMDGVIIDSEAAHEKSADIVFERHGVRRIEGDSQIIKGLRDDEMFEVFKRLYPLKADTKTLKDERTKAFLELAEKEVKLFPGFHEIALVLSKSYRLAITTSSVREMFDLANKKFGIGNYFSAVVTGEQVANGKPHPEAYLHTCRLLKVKPSEAVVIEDTVNGVKSAKAAGCKCIAITNSYSRNELREADMIVQGLSEIPKAVKELDL